MMTLSKRAPMSVGRGNGPMSGTDLEKGEAGHTRASARPSFTRVDRGLGPYEPPAAAKGIVVTYCYTVVIG